MSQAALKTVSEQTTHIAIDHPVPMVAKKGESDCWKVCIQMLLGGDKAEVNAEGVKLSDNGALTYTGADMSNIKKLADNNKLAYYAPHRELSLFEIRALIVKGPVMTILDYPGKESGHAVVVCGAEITGDRVHIADPEPPGKKYWISWPELARALPNVTVALLQK